MKRNWRRWAAGVSVALSIGAVFWMRALASWRPVVVAKVNFQPEQIRFSRDGRLLVAGDAAEAIIDVKNGVVSNRERVTIFDTNRGLETFPRVEFDRVTGRLNFLPTREQKTNLPIEIRSESDVIVLRDGNITSNWSKEKGEVYCWLDGEVHTWNWNGKLIKRVRFTKSASTRAVFSPDGRWLLAVEKVPSTSSAHRFQFHNVLRRYDVQTGKVAASTHVWGDIWPLQFSPDGKQMIAGGEEGRARINVFNTSTWKKVWIVDAVVSSGWSSNHRVGLVKPTRFEWRDRTSGEILQTLPGPSHGSKASDWNVSPDGDWIYTCHSDGTIRKWRAR